MENKFIAIINGPNLNKLGRRDSHTYGKETFDETLKMIKEKVGNRCEIRYSQSNCEGAIIDLIQEYAKSGDCIGIVINPGAYAHYSYAIADAIADVECSCSVFEVHISNIFRREDYRHTSVTATQADGLIAGFGRYGYYLAVEQILHLCDEEKARLDSGEILPF